MIKINLLENHLSVPESQHRHLGETTGETVIRKEARKSYRFLIIMICVLTGLVGLSIAGYIFRHEIVSFAEQYTGPLDLFEPVEPEISGELVEEMRREKIRNEYMINTYALQRRNYVFLSRVDSVDQANDQLWISVLNLDVNDFKVEAFGRNENQFTEFTKQLVLTPYVESVKPSDSKATSVMRGYTLKKTITGSLKVLTEVLPDTASAPKFTTKDSALIIMNQLAAATGIKLKTESQMAQNKGVIMNKFRGHARAEALSSQLMLFLKEFNSRKLNCEWVSYQLTYAAQKGKRKTKPDTLLLDFEIFIPNKSSDPHGSTGTSSRSSR